MNKMKAKALEDLSYDVATCIFHKKKLSRAWKPILSRYFDARIADVDAYIMKFDVGSLITVHSGDVTSNNVSEVRKKLIEEVKNQLKDNVYGDWS